MKKNGLASLIFVSLLTASIMFFIIFGAYQRKLVKTELLLSLASLLIIYFKGKKPVIRDFFAQYFSSRYLPFIFFCFCVLLSTVFSKDFRHSLNIFRERYLLYFLVFEIGRGFFASKTVSGTLDGSFGMGISGLMKYIFIFAGLLMGMGGVVDYIRIHPERLFSVFGQEIQFYMLPLYIVYFLPVVYCFMFKGNTRIQRLLAVLTFALLSMCMVFAGARAGWFAGPISILFASFLINKRLLKYFIPGLLVYLCAIYFFMPARMINFASYFPRKDIMQAAVGIFRDNVFFGAGPGMYERLVYNYSKGYVHIHAHSTYLEILAELGIVGLIAFLAIFVSFYWRVFKKISTIGWPADKFLYTGLLASCAACLVYAIFESVITVGFHDAPLFWLIFGMSFGLESSLSVNSPVKQERMNDG
jgi:O-antigen ligase